MTMIDKQFQRFVRPTLAQTNWALKKLLTTKNYKNQKTFSITCWKMEPDQTKA